jgi:hypothetical protein
VNPKELAGRIAAAGDGRVRSLGREGYLVVCPAHDDGEPSLHLSAGEQHEVVLHCFAGCTVNDVLAAAGLTLADLCGGGAPGALACEEYHYVDEREHYLYTIRRLGHGADKSFSCYHIDGAGTRIANARGLRRALYRLPEVLAAVARGETIYLCEGEKDVEALRSRYGVTATTNAFGATSWAADCQTYDYATPLRRADVVVVQDRDAAGRQRTNQIRASLTDVVASLRVVEATSGKDAADHVAAGHALAELREVKESESFEDDGTFTAVPKALTNRLRALNPTHLEHRIVFELVCHGAHRQEAKTRFSALPSPSSWLARMCGGASPAAVRKALSRLREANIVIGDGDPVPGHANVLAINSAYAEWRPLTRKRRSSSRARRGSLLSPASTPPAPCEHTNTREDLVIT